MSSIADDIFSIEHLPICYSLCLTSEVLSFSKMMSLYNRIIYLIAKIALKIEILAFFFVTDVKNEWAHRHMTI